MKHRVAAPPVLVLLLSAALLAPWGEHARGDAASDGAGRGQAGERRAPARGRITVLADARVDSEAIRLGDVAHLEGFSAAPARDLAALEVGRAPAPGGVRTLAGAAILAALRGHGVDLQQVRYLIPPVIRVHRRGQQVSAATLEGIVESHLEEHLGTAAGELRLRKIDVPGSVRLAPGAYTPRLTLMQRAPVGGRMRVHVELLQDGRVAGSTTATAHVALYGDVCVTRRMIPRGALVSGEDVVLERRDVGELRPGVITRLEDAVGKEAKVALAPLRPLRHEQLDVPTVVRRGDVVTLLARSGGLEITTKGEVREDAPRDAQVRVWNLESGKEVVGRVVDDKTVAVTF